MSLSLQALKEGYSRRAEASPLTLTQLELSRNYDVISAEPISVLTKEGGKERRKERERDEYPAFKRGDKVTSLIPLLRLMLPITLLQRLVQDEATEPLP